MPVAAKKASSKEICIISQYWYPDIVGDVSRVAQIIEVLKKDGWKITLLTSRPHYPEGDPRGFHFKFTDVRMEEGVKVIRIVMPRLPHRGFLNRLILYVWFASFSAVFASVIARGVLVWAFSQRVFSTYASLPSKVIWGSVIVSDVTDVWPEALVNTGYATRGSILFAVGRVLARFAYHVTDVVSTMTPELASSISALHSVPRGRIVVVPYVGRSFQRGRKAPSPFTVLYYGNLGPNYDFEFLLAVANRLLGTDVRFSIKGDGEQLGGVRQAIIEQRLDNVRLSSAVLNEQGLSDLVVSADVLILPMSKSEFSDVSFPGKFVEYLQAGKPVIYIGDGLPARLVEEHDLGLATSERDADEVARFILKLHGDPQLAERLGTNARRLAEETYSEKQLTDSLCVLDRVIGAQR